MNPSLSTPPPNPAIEHQAAAWLARHDCGLTAAEQDDFFHWLAADPRHGEWLALHRRTARGLAHLAQWRPEHAAKPNPDLLAQTATQAVRHRWWWPVGLAAAGVALALAWPSFRSTANSAARIFPVATEEPIVRRLLDDGSTIDLNHGARVEVLFSPALRRVRIVRGEAHFTVAKNPQRPFVVEAGGAEVRALGTAFNVRFAPKAIEVLVTEGRVEVRRSPSPEAAPDPAPPPVVSAGERALVSLAGPAVAPRVTPVAAEEMARLLAWQPRLLEFVDAPLALVVAEFNRDSRVKLVVADPALAALPIGATLRSDNLEGFVRLLEKSFHVAVERRDDATLVLRRSAP